MSCQSCSTKFNLFKKKRNCYFCEQAFCRNCIREADRKVKCEHLPNKSLHVQLCTKCVLMSSPSVTLEQLMRIDVKYMRLFLISRKISIAGYNEKTELAQLILNYNSDVYSSGNGSNINNITYNNSFTTTNYNNSALNRSSPINEETMNVSEETTVPTSTPSPPVSETPTPDVVNETEGNSGANSNPPASPERQLKRVASLSQLESLDDIEKLSIRDIKVILAKNFVNFAGCVEKNELKLKLKALYESNKDMENRIRESEEGGEASKTIDNDLNNNIKRLDDDLCKICMDRLIDCVLVECGHMCACVKCGKLLSECPICRQYVVRCIRVFKS